MGGRGWLPQQHPEAVAGEGPWAPLGFGTRAAAGPAPSRPACTRRRASADPWGGGGHRDSPAAGVTAGPVCLIKCCWHKQRITSPVRWERAERGTESRGNYIAADGTLMMLLVSFKRILKCCTEQLGMKSPGSCPCLPTGKPVREVTLYRTNFATS